MMEYSGLFGPRAPPNVCASLPSSDSSDGDADTSDLEWSLPVSAGAEACYSPHSGKAGL